jgi:hypothetical protein
MRDCLADQLFGVPSGSGETGLINAAPDVAPTPGKVFDVGIVRESKRYFKHKLNRVRQLSLSRKLPADPRKSIDKHG